MWRSETGRPWRCRERSERVRGARRSLLVAGLDAPRLFDLHALNKAPVRRPLPAGARVAGVAVTERGPRALITRRGASGSRAPAAAATSRFTAGARPSRALFSADGSRVLTLFRRRKPCLWNALDGRRVATLSEVWDTRGNQSRRALRRGRSTGMRPRGR